MVREFYANAVENRDDNTVFVLGKHVPFDAQTINRFYGTPSFVKDEYSKFLNEDIDLNVVLATIGLPDTQWTISTTGV